MSGRFAFFALFASTSEAARFSSKEHSTLNSTARGIVDNLYTFGAPKVSSPEARNGASGNGCFTGYRVVNSEEKIFWEVDMVPSLMVTLSYVHPDMPTLFLHGNGGNKLRSCGDRPVSFSTPNTALHEKDTYISRSESYGNNKLKKTAQVGLQYSYEGNLNTVRSGAKQYGWRLVGSASVGEDVSHVFQNPSTKECQVTFEGSDSFSDWITDAKIKQVDFCGRGGVHLGFSNELTRISNDNGWQNNVRSKLSGCSSVSATGHSLGGAVATLFAECVNSGRTGDSTYNKLAWTKGAAIEHPEF